ncbi:hypothetical protein AMATHDRAFT_72594 [Amanita thiersii Skay4041]|uniref:S1 motif domain-containing protein n=1 Tax=Amanita thiersii Skay4041 TaxID=703135 RepID=A0A2A9NV17_9AGAR|nr:hypothetical protein AMATHDRAFT_72594 [Amanita thiersii Skay4041]
MAPSKRPLDDPSTPSRTKKKREDVDFPRGGGTTLTPAEVKAFRAEAIQEANEELFHDATLPKRDNKRKCKPGISKSSFHNKGEKIRIEHLSYKRLSVGMKILGQIVSVQPLALIVSLPNQLFAHIPITNISPQYTSLLETMDTRQEETELEDETDDGDGTDLVPPQINRCPELSDMFHVGQYVRAAVTAVYPPGSNASNLSKSRDELVKASRRVELSLFPEKINAGVQKSDINIGFTLSVAVKSIEDHGYILDLGIPDVSGFLSFKDAQQEIFKKRLSLGWLLDVTISKVSGNRRICEVSAVSSRFSSTCLSEAINSESILPGSLVQSLITATNPLGLNLQVLGLFDGTVDEFHLHQCQTEKVYKVGKKVKARILYNYGTSPPKYALALTQHILELGSRTVKGQDNSPPKNFEEAYPIGTVLEAVKVLRVAADWGIIVEVQPGLEGFVHMSHLTDDHITSLGNTGPWKVGSLHRARITGYFAFDGLLQLSLRPSVLNQKFLQIDDLNVGQVVKGTIKKLTDSGLFVSLSGNVDGVVWPNHYADIPLKHPGKRFKPGVNIKCRVLVVDSDRKKLSLTAKKTLVDSTLPVLSKMEEVERGVTTHAVVFKVTDSALIIEFYNHLKAVVPAKELSETPVANLAELYTIGKVVKVRIIAVDPEQPRIVASIRQATSSLPLPIDVSVGVGDTVHGEVTGIHKENILLSLKPSQIPALLSLKNLANHRNMSLTQLRVDLKTGEQLDELIVVTRNPEKGLVIVANKPKNSAGLPSKSSALKMDTITTGQTVLGRVIRQNRQGSLLKINAHIGGILHPTDASDNYDFGNAFPAVDSILKAIVIEVNPAKKQLVLSMRPSRFYPKKTSEIVDREIQGLGDLQVGDVVRGFIKSVTDHGLFVSIARGVDARIQIKELFDEYVKDWKPRFRANQLVKGRILSVNMENKKVEMTFKSDELLKRTQDNTSINDLTKGQKVDGIVKKIESYGLFIQIDGTSLQGLCHKSEISDNKEADIHSALQGFRQGDHVKAIVINIEQRRISLSIKPSYFDQEDFGTSDDVELRKSQESSFGIIENEDNDNNLSSHHGDAADSDNSRRYSDDDEDASMLYLNGGEEAGSMLLPPAQLATASAPMKINKFHWFEDQANAERELPSEESSSEIDVEDQLNKRKRKKRKQIEEDLTAHMHSKAPESNADFERLLLGSPNSSYLWIQYMSFQLELSEVDKARDVARRAINTINFREEQERLNVWIALLNLENVYGTGDSLDKAFKEAARANDSKTVHLRLASIFDESEKYERAENQFNKTCKKFGQSSKVWSSFGEFYLRRGNLEEARRLLPRSLQSLEKRKHLKTITKFAQLEYKFGDPERGRTVFEGIVDSHPKRWDLWSIYIDMEAGQGNIQSLRNLFDRVFTLKMTSHKAKSFFKKWLDLEHKLGDEQGASAVKEKAIEWTQRATNTS